MTKADSNSAVTKAENSRSGLVIGIIQIIAIAAFMFVAVSFSLATKKDPAKAAIAEQDKISVPVIRPNISDGEVLIAVTGTVNARASVALVPQVSGRIDFVSSDLRPGGKFKAGQTLMRIEQDDYALAVEQAKADVASAETALALERAEATTASEEWNILYPGEPIPELVARKPQIAQAEARLASAKARVSDAGLRLKRTVFSLPFDGVVQSTSAEPGQFAAAGQPVGQAYSVGTLEISAPVSTDELQKLQPATGRSAKIYTGTQILDAEITRVSAQLDPQTRFATVFLASEDISRLIPGTFVDVEIEGQIRESTLKLPVSAEQERGLVWFVDAGQLQSYLPTVISRRQNYILVESFDYGQGIVSQTIAGARDGLDVDIAE